MMGASQSINLCRENDDWLADVAGIVGLRRQKAIEVDCSLSLSLTHSLSQFLAV